MCKYSFGPFSSFFRQLENYYPGQLGSSDSCRLQDSLCGSTSSVATKSHTNQVQHSEEAHEHRYPDASREGSNQGGSASQEPIYFHPIPSRESPICRRISANYQPETLKQICRRVVLQDGGSSGSPFVDTTERLYDETRSQGRVLFGPDPPRLSQIPTLCVQREDIRVPMSSLRSEISPSRFHQANDSHHSPYQEFGDTNCHLHRRHSHLTSVSHCSTIYLQEDCDPSRAFGIPHQSKKMFATPFSATYLPGNNAQHCHIVPVLAEREAGSHSTGSTPATYQGQRYTTGVSYTPGTHELCSSEWHLAGPAALSRSSEGAISWNAKIGVQQFETVPRSVTGGYEGPDVVAFPGAPEHQCSTPQMPTIRSGHPHRCIPIGLGATADNTSIGGRLSNISTCSSSKQRILPSKHSHRIGDHPQLIFTCASTTPQRWPMSTRGGARAHRPCQR